MTGASLSSAGEVVVIRPTRRIGSLYPHAVVEESHADSLEITDHPVEKGAAISDHAFLKPAEVTLKLMWGEDDSTDPSEVYTALLDLQSSCSPFDVVTGKRAYRNMLIKSMAVTTDRPRENILMVTLVCRQVTIAATVESSLTDLDALLLPLRTAAVVETGVKVLKTLEE